MLKGKKFLFLLGILACYSIHAQETIDIKPIPQNALRVSGGMQMGIFMYTPGNSTYTKLVQNPQAEGGTGDFFGLSYSRLVHKNVSARLGFGYFRNHFNSFYSFIDEDNQTELAGRYVSESDGMMINLGASNCLNFRRFRYNYGAQLRVMLADFHTTNYVYDHLDRKEPLKSVFNVRGIGGEENTYNSLGFSLFSSLDYYLTSNLYLGLEAGATYFGSREMHLDISAPLAHAINVSLDLGICWTF